MYLYETNVYLKAQRLKTIDTNSLTYKVPVLFLEDHILYLISNLYFKFLILSSIVY